MLFMTIYTNEPEQRNEILKKRSKGLFVPEGATFHGQWTSISGRQVFTLVEFEDPLVGVQCFQDWTDLGKMKFIPVMETDKLFKALAAMR